MVIPKSRSNFSGTSAGASHIRSVPLAVLGNGNHVADGSLARQDHHQPVEAERDAAVRRSAVLERFEQEAEACAGPLRR